MKCSFCKKEITKGKGIAFVRRTGSIIFFCSSKCRKNHDMKRNPRNLKWITKKK